MLWGILIVILFVIAYLSCLLDFGFVSVLIVILLIIVIWFAATYNTLVQGRNDVKALFAQIDTLIQDRFDLTSNLIEIVKDYVSLEKEVLEDITNAKNEYMNATTNAEKIAAENQLTSTLKTLFAVTENYPELKANVNFTELQYDLKGTEELIAILRKTYNGFVTGYNNSLTVFPNNIIAGMFHFTEETLFQVDDAEETSFQIDGIEV